MDADIEAARRDIERECNVNTKGRIVWRTELSDDIPGWAIMRPVPPEDWDRDPDEYRVLGPMCLVRIQDRAEVNLYCDSPCWPTVCAVIREGGEKATADEIHTELHHRWKEEEEHYQAEARAQRRERWKFWKRITS